MRMNRSRILTFIRNTVWNYLTMEKHQINKISIVSIASSFSNESNRLLAENISLFLTQIQKLCTQHVVISMWQRDCSPIHQPKKKSYYYNEMLCRHSLFQLINIDNTKHWSCNHTINFFSLLSNGFHSHSIIISEIKSIHLAMSLS